MQRRSGEKTSHIETIITKGIKLSPLQAGSRIGQGLIVAVRTFNFSSKKPRKKLHAIGGAAKVINSSSVLPFK